MSFFSFNQILSEMRSQTSRIEAEEPIASTSSGSHDNQEESKPIPMPTALDGTPLISVKALPMKYQSVFIKRFPHFNCVQSKVFEDVFNSDKSIALCAPTSSGKTVVFELAIIKKLIDLEKSNQTVTNLRAVYMAPLKKLVDEKHKEFVQSFRGFGLSCLQFTGDSDFEDYGLLSTANIVLTTPEKWDSMLRNNQNCYLIRNVELVLIDEIHSIGVDQRGATMEAVISRMKTLRSVHIQQNISESKMRFIAASATAPNVEDIAHWLDRDNNVGHNMSKTYRPVSIQTLVFGYSCGPDITDFKFDINLNYKLDSIIKSHCDSKPTLIFCSTRKSVEMTAKCLSNPSKSSKIFKTYFNDSRQKLNLEADIRRMEFKDKNLFCFIKNSGIGYHHSGLDKRDKQNVERLFTQSLLPVLISTTTLSMGVNLPAHLVIIKNTTQFESNGVVHEYPETLIMQMIGRAGRPQFDTSAVAVIMTKSEKRTKYEMLLNGSQIIESKLHLHLIEHLNAEIALRTVTSLDIAVRWIRETFLYIRLLKNPSVYQKSIQIENREQGIQVINEWCIKELTELKDAELIEADQTFSAIGSTHFGRLMARHCISFETMKKLCQLTERELEMTEIIEEISKYNELLTEIQIRVSDKKILNELNQKSIRYPMAGKIKSTDMKINCLIQTTLGSENYTISDNTLNQESVRILRTGQRLSKCLSDLIVFKVNQNISQIYFNTLLNGIKLNKCFKAKLWPDSKQLTKQFNRIGDRISMKIMEKYKSFAELKKADPRNVEFLAERRPPFGTQLINWVNRLPYYSLKIKQNVKTYNKTNEVLVRVEVRLENFDDLKEKEPLLKNHCSFIIVGNDCNQLFYCQQLFDSKLLNNNGFFETKDIVIGRNDRSQYISAHLISDSHVGFDVECRLRPMFAADTDVTPELIRTNCSTAFSDVSCEPNSRSDSNSSEGCQHKCANKFICRHNCCKKGLVSDKNHNSNEIQSQKQATKTKRQLNCEQSSSKRSKQNKTEDKRCQTNLDNWVKKYIKTDTNSNVKTESDYFKNKNYSEVTNKDMDSVPEQSDDIKDSNTDNDSNNKTKSDYFKNEKYSEIPEKDTDLDFVAELFDDLNDWNPDIDSNESNNLVKIETNEQIIKNEEPDDDFDDEEFDEEFDEMFDKYYGNNLDQLVAEDFQNFNDVTEKQSKPIARVIPTEDYPFSMAQWGVFMPTTQLEGKTFFVYE